MGSIAPGTPDSLAMAMATAVADACGARVRELPITAEKMHRNITSTPR
ncbi:MAG: hypothetical protein O2812_04180 [Chloroflexi bacterium]|nr:hypothetical protein [Chloroflexota bacterium]